VVKGVEQGEGMVGKVLRDPELAKKLDHTITEASAFADRLTGLKVEVGLRSEGHYKLGGTPAFNTKHTFGARLLPAKSSRYYGFDVVADTSGNLSRRVETVTGATTPSCAAPPCTVITDTLTDKFRVNAYLAQKWGPATFRIGMMESTGGVGVDLDIIENMLQVRADIFDFTEPANVNPHLRAMLRFSFLDNFDLYAGAGDVFNGPLEGPAGTVFTGRGRSVFLGAGFHFTDDDLKAILTTTGVPSF
jgi:phospholipid/cholesterol/gamma-HCH transport system substrate-binding protein